jgi:hypothetical protein
MFVANLIILIIIEINSQIRVNWISMSHTLTTNNYYISILMQLGATTFDFARSMHNTNYVMYVQKCQFPGYVILGSNPTNSNWVHMYIYIQHRNVITLDRRRVETTDCYFFRSLSFFKQSEAFIRTWNIT